MAGFDAGLVLRLARQPVWLLGMASMILGFAFQVSALRFGPLALLQPILATEDVPDNERKSRRAGAQGGTGGGNADR